MNKHLPRLGLLLILIVSLLTTTIWLWNSPRSAFAGLQEEPNTPVTDLVIDAIEITQSVQDLDNSVPLVAGKRTFVRLYAHSTNGVYPTTATLTATSGALTQTILPIKPGGPIINVRPTYNRLMPTHAFLFELPLWATFGQNVFLSAQVNPSLRWRPRSPEEYSYANNTLSKTVSFDPVPTLHLVIADQPYTFNNQFYSARAYDRWKALEWISRVYPLSNVKVYFRTLPLIQAQRKLDKNKNWVLIYPTCSWLNLYMAYHRAAIFGNPFVPKTATFLSIVWDDINVGFMRGCAPINGMLDSTGYTRVASGPVGNQDWGWDFDGSYADWYSGHEVGHAWSQFHVRGGPGYVKDGCGGEAKAVKQNLNGSISPVGDIFDPTVITGFDSLSLAQGKNPILGPYWSDMMTYCDYLWMSKTTYVALKNMFNAYLPLTVVDTPHRSNAQEALAIFGELDPLSGAVSMLPVSVITSEAELVPPATGPYAVVFRAAGGEELARYPFTPANLDGGPAPEDGNEQETAYIALLLPNIRAIASLELEGPGGVLYQIKAGLNLPAVQVTSPNGGEVFGEAPITVSWIASDIDGDSLTFNVDYSPDNGASWEPVAQHITETQVTIDQVNLPASDMALFRVSASDGIHTSVDQSDGIFFIPNHLPSGEIVAPAMDTTIASDQTIAFQGQVYDYDLGTLDDANLQWWSDRDGMLGNGSILSSASLSQGLHEINLVADDGQGQYIVDQVIVTVVSTPNDLPPQPNALVAGPDLVFLYPTAGVSGATLYLDNQNLGVPIAWGATSDQDWVELSAYSGVAPQDITVSTSLTGRDFGTHKALLTFFDPDGQYEPVYVILSAAIPKYDLFLPIMAR